MRMQKFRRSLAAAASLIVSIASFALSFVALRDVAASSGAVPPYLAWLVPIVIDGGVICGSAIIWSESHEDAKRPLFPFLFTGALVIVSVVVNAAHASGNVLAKSIAALPPLILLGTLELVAAQGRRAKTDGGPVQYGHTVDQSTAPQAAPAVSAPAAQESAAPTEAATPKTAAKRASKPAAPKRPRTTTTRPSAPPAVSAPAPTPVEPVGEALTTPRRTLRVAAQPAEFSAQ